MWSKLKHTCTNYMDKIMTKNSELFNECIRSYNVHFHAKKSEKAKNLNRKHKKSEKQKISIASI